MSVTNELQQSMLNAMQLLSTKAVNSADATLTVKCTITNIVDAGLGLYEIEYGNNKFNAYTNPNIIYKINDQVYVLVPDGDFSQQKMIIGAVAPAATMLVTEEPSDLYVPISGNLLTQDIEIDLKSWVDEEIPLSDDYFNNFGFVFKDYLNIYKTFLFTANIKTEIDKDHQTKGNYGLILELPFLSNTTVEGQPIKTRVWRSYIMDVTTIPGNPYDFNVYQKVNLYYPADDTLEYDTTTTPRIRAFVKGFGYTAPRTDIISDIHIKNIGIKIIDILSEQEKDGYSLTIVSDDGNYFLAGRYVKNKTLTPYLKIKGKDTKLTNWDCYWFVEDSSIDITSQDYLSLGGLGWKCLNKKTNISYDAEGNKTFQYVTNNYNYVVESSAVKATARYKCVVVQKDVVVGDLIRLTNLNANIETNLISATGSNIFLADIGYVDLIARIYYEGVTDNPSSAITLKTAWQRFDKSDNYLDNDFYEIIRYNDPVEIKGKTYFETEIKYSCSKMDQLNTINCTFYSITNQEGELIENNLGTNTIIVTAQSGLQYGLAIQGGDVLYKYDADGDSPLVANYDGPISSQIKTIDPIGFRVYKADGTELSEVEYLYCHYTWKFPKNSMMSLKGHSSQQLKDLEQDDDYYYISGYGIQGSNINYTIANTYNKKKNNNTIILIVDFDGTTMTDVVSPKFLKDGESGTNGSKFSALITYAGIDGNDYAYGERDANGKIRKLQLIYVDNSWKIYDADNNQLINFNNPQLKISVYRDGEKINSGYEISWSIFDSFYTDPCFTIDSTTGRLSIKENWDIVTKEYCNTVEAKIKVSDTSATNSDEYIYAYYPIEITRLMQPSMADGVIPNLDGGFEQVVYASDGTNPQYDNSNDFLCIDNLYNDDIGNYYDYTWTYSNNLRGGSGTGPSASIKPITKYDTGQSKNFVKVVLNMSQEHRQQINTKINELNELIKNDLDLIDFYTKNKDTLALFLTQFNYEDIINHLNNTKMLLFYRGEMLIYITNMLKALEDINQYCINSNISINDFNYVNYYRNCTMYLDNAYNILYKLGYGANFNSISDLRTAFITLDKDRIKAKYGAGVASSLSSYVQAYNLILTEKYQKSFVKIVEQIGGVYTLQDEFDELKSLEQKIIALPQDTNLKKLVEGYSGNPTPALQEFKNLKDQLDALIILLTDSSTKILINYSAFVNNLFKPIDSLLSIYNNTEYQERFYNNLLTELNKEKENYEKQKADYSAALLPNNSYYIVHLKPIIMILNRYELSNINGWDGNKLYIDTQNEEYLLAPQVGAGKKDNGLFTGVVMGVKQFKNSVGKEQRIGLIGYSQGIQSFLLNAEDGSAILGKSGKGQILIDPNDESGRIYSGNFYKNMDQDGKPTSYTKSNENEEGMLINLTLPEIRFGNGNFSIDEEGKLRAAGEGWIGGWKINDTQIYSNITASNGRITLDSGTTTDGTLDEEGHKVYTESTGGKIYSHNHNKLSSTNQGFYLSKDGLSIGNTIKITSTTSGTVEVGRLTGKHWTIDGDSNHAYIGYGDDEFRSNPRENSIGGSGGQVYIGTDGIRLGNRFAVDANGNVAAKYLVAKDGGSIGGWEIKPNSLEANGIIISSAGNIKGNNWEITNGSATFNNITANGSGQIGGWSINGSTLSGGGISLNPGNIDIGSGVLKGTGFNLSNAGLNLSSGKISFGGTTWDGSSFRGGGGATYDSSASNPLKGSCVTQVDELIANKVSAAYIESKIGEIGTLNVNSLLCSGGGATGNWAVNGTLSGGTVTAGGQEVATKSWCLETFQLKS